MNPVRIFVYMTFMTKRSSIYRMVWIDNQIPHVRLSSCMICSRRRYISALLNILASSDSPQGAFFSLNLFQVQKWKNQRFALIENTFLNYSKSLPENNKEEMGFLIWERERRKDFWPKYSPFYLPVMTCVAVGIKDVHPFELSCGILEGCQFIHGPTTSHILVQTDEHLIN